MYIMTFISTFVDTDYCFTVGPHGHLDCGGSYLYLRKVLPYSLYITITCVTATIYFVVLTSLGILYKPSCIIPALLLKVTLIIQLLLLELS